MADEDHAALRVVDLPLGASDARTVPLPGRPGNVVALRSAVLITIRR